MLAEGFYLKSPAQPPITDKDQLRQGLTDYHENYISTVDWEIEDIRLFDEQAVVRGK